MSAPTKTLASGGKRAAKAAAENKEKRANGSNFSLWEYFQLAEPAKGEVYGGSAVVRFVTDEPQWVEGKVHSFIPVKKAPADKPEDRSWKAQQDALCRYTVINHDTGETLEDDCYICDKVRVTKNGKENQKPFASTRMWAVAIIRQPVKATQEHVDAGLVEAYEIGSYPDALYEDEMVEKEIDGKNVKVPHYVVMNFGMKNFFDSLLGFENIYNTVVDRDYRITRKGVSTETDYIIAPLEVQKKIPNPDSPFFGQKNDLRNPEIAEQYKFSDTQSWNEMLQALVLRKATDAWYGLHFDITKQTAWEEVYPKRAEKAADGDAPSETTTSASKAENDTAQEATNQATIDQMRKRMQGK